MHTGFGCQAVIYFRNLFGNFTLGKSLPGSGGRDGANSAYELGHRGSQAFQFILKILVLIWQFLIVESVADILECNRNLWLLTEGEKPHLDRSLVSGGKQRLHTPLNTDELVVHLNGPVKITTFGESYICTTKHLV